ncbi:hypothetical protein BTI82_04880 [Lactobacillus delbrueckii subsp. bulgaricus]|nr:hypothetical protein [Lactobacillus delbrueckii subsp. bulgaricus]
MKLKFPKDIRVNLCIICLIYIMFVGFFTYNFSLPQSLLYVSDGILLILFIFSIHKIKSALSVEILRQTFIPALLVAIMGTISALISNINLLQLIWAYRNWGRLFVYLTLCYTSLKEKHITSTIKFIKIIYHLNFFVIIAQYLSHSSMYTQDQLNGLFGRDTSSINVTVSLFILVIILSEYFSKKEKGTTIIPYFIEITVVAILAELKAVMIFEIIFVLVYMLVNSSLDAITMLKRVLFVLLLVVAVIAGSHILARIYPTFENLLNLRNIILSMTTSDGYGHSGYIDRLNGIDVINKYFFDSMGWKYKLMGLGIGKAEYSSITVLQSDFYIKYGLTFSYLNFTSSFLYLETGLFGLIGYTICFLLPFVSYIKLIKKQIGKQNGFDANMVYWANVGLGSTLVALLFIIYNNLERTDAAYIVAFFMAAPAVAIYKQRK